MPNTYDIIISGGGLAGLSLVHHLLHSPWREKRILLIDREQKRANDRTWCFWEASPGPFEHLVHQRWDRLHFYGPEFGRRLDIRPYEYKMIRGIDFYRSVGAEIEAAPNVELRYGQVERLIDAGEKGQVQLTDGSSFEADWVFNSIFFGTIDRKTCNYLDQHFKGWVVRTSEPAFDADTAVLMDFRIPQLGETRFFYVLPLDDRQALVELAIFSNDHLTDAGYDELIAGYLREYVTDRPYEIVHQEKGVIPMTDHPFPQREGRILHIGTAGGHTKPSTGYTFWRLQGFLQRMVADLAASGDPLPRSLLSKRHLLYDSILLNVLLRGNLPSERIFTDMFRKNPPARVLRFLNEETSLLEEVRIMRSVPMAPFLGALVREVR